MANTASRGYTFSSTELVTNSKLHSLVDSATLTIDTISVALGNLSNVSLTSVVNTQVLQYNGTVWSNASISSGGGSVTRYTGTFNYGSLVSGIVSVAHLVSLAAPYDLNVSMAGASSSGYFKMFPDEISYGASAFSIDMRSFLTASNASVYYGWSYLG